MLALQKGAAWVEGGLLGALRHSVPQNGRVHLHIIEILLCGRYQGRGKSTQEFVFPSLALAPQTLCCQGCLRALFGKEFPPPLIGACAMTTKFLDSKIGTLSWRFLRKTVLLDDCPNAPPLQKNWRVRVCGLKTQKTQRCAITSFGLCRSGLPQGTFWKRISTTPLIGACAMTTKFLDNTVSTFKFLLSWRIPRKTAFLDDFPLRPQCPPPFKTNI